MIGFIATIGQFIPGLFGKKLAYQTAKAAGIGVLIIFLIAILSLGKCAYDKSVVNGYKAEQAAKIAPAKEKASESLATSTVENAKKEEELHVVIHNAPKGGELSPAAHALACERLRRYGRHPAACNDKSTR